MSGVVKNRKLQIFAQNLAAGKSYTDVAGGLDTIPRSAAPMQPGPIRVLPRQHRLVRANPVAAGVRELSRRLRRR
jgi:hypothetical protein